MITFERKYRILFRILFGVYVATVLFLCFARFDSAPDVPRSLFGIPTDKVVHFCMFFPFPFLAFLAFDSLTETFWSSLFWALGAFAAGAVLAGMTELVQARTTYRSGDPMDFLADIIALGIASIAVFTIDYAKQPKTKQL